MLDISELEASKFGLCECLKSHKEISEAVCLAENFGLVGHLIDEAKAWDCIKTLSYLKDLDKSSRVLDAGSGQYSSTILYWLKILGFKHLFACDKKEQLGWFSEQEISFSKQDITKTNYPDSYFDGICCLSVIEHGVDYQKFFQEMSRILKTGSRLLVSTDFWNSKVDTYNLRKDGKKIKILDPNDIYNIIKSAKNNGLETTSNLDLTVNDKVIKNHKKGFSYTFIFIPFIKY